MAKPGRPTKYKQEYVKLAYNTCREKGCTNKQLGEVLGVSCECIAEWQRRYSDFSDAIKRGKEEFDTERVEVALLKRAVGFQFTETTEQVGKIADPKTGEPKLVTTKVVTKELAPDPTSMIFWLKNRQPQRWRDKQSVEVGVSIEDVINGLPEDFAGRVRKALGELISGK